MKEYCQMSIIYGGRNALRQFCAFSVLCIEKSPIEHQLFLGFGVQCGFLQVSGMCQILVRIGQKVFENQLKRLRHLARLNLLDDLDCIGLFDTGEGGDRRLCPMPFGSWQKTPVS